MGEYALSNSAPAPWLSSRQSNTLSLPAMRARPFSITAASSCCVLSTVCLRLTPVVRASWLKNCPTPLMPLLISRLYRTRSSSVSSPSIRPWSMATARASSGRFLSLSSAM